MTASLDVSANTRDDKPIVRMTQRCRAEHGRIDMRRQFLSSSSDQTKKRRSRRNNGVYRAASRNGLLDFDPALRTRQTRRALRTRLPVPPPTRSADGQVPETRRLSRPVPSRGRRSPRGRSGKRRPPGAGSESPRSACRQSLLGVAVAVPHATSAGRMTKSYLVRPEAAFLLGEFYREGKAGRPVSRRARLLETDLAEDVNSCSATATSV